MERKSVCLVVGFLGLLCAVTGFSAEATKSKGGLALTSSGCLYRRTPALGLGLTAAMSLLIAQIIINETGDCKCCCFSFNRSNPCWTTGLVFCLLSWLATVLALPVLIGAALLNESHMVTFGQDNIYFSNTSCPGFKSGVFAGATVLSLASIALGIIYYLISSAEDQSVHPITYNQDGIAIAQPQYPAPHNAHV